jgi:hypothetical protein
MSSPAAGISLSDILSKRELTIETLVALEALPAVMVERRSSRASVPAGASREGKGSARME